MKQDDLKQFESDYDKAQEKVHEIFLNETAEFIKQFHHYNSKTDLYNAHTKSLPDMVVEELYNMGYRKEPYKIGETVYWTANGKIFEVKIAGINHQGIFDKDYNLIGERTMYDVYEEGIGRYTVPLSIAYRTREEAEKGERNEIK